MADTLLDHLRAALRLSPDNAPLRLSFVRALLEQHHHEEAEAECRAGLARRPHDPELSTALAQAFLALGRFSMALTVAEDLVARGTATAATWMVIARSSLEQEDPQRAGEAYRRARDLDPSLRDERLAHLASPPAAPRPAAAAPREPAYVAGDPDAKFDPYTERPKITFADVGGMEELKNAIRLKILHPLRQPEIYRAYGKKIGGGILMYGPPGCGKTHVARATAGEGGARFVNTAIADVLDMYIGQSERNLRDVFAQARAEKPTVLFFDEVDALAASRRDMRQSAGRQVINQFLSELDGFETDNEGVLVMAATNAPWHLDTAFRRPGRFDRILFVPPPDEAARATILKILLRGKPAGDADIAAIAGKTADFSGADLRALVDRAIEDKLGAALASGHPEPLTTKDLLRAAKSLRPSTREWFQVARNHAIYANANGLYDDVLAYLNIKR